MWLHRDFSLSFLLTPSGISAVILQMYELLASKQKNVSRNVVCLPLRPPFSRFFGFSQNVRVQTEFLIIHSSNEKKFTFANITQHQGDLLHTSNIAGNLSKTQVGSSWVPLTLHKGIPGIISRILRITYFVVQMLF